MIESALIKKSYFSNKSDGINLDNIISSISSSRKNLLNVAKMKQTHSNEVEFINSDGEFLSDGIITSQRDIALVVQTADCMPVLIKSDISIAALHIGWRGLQNNIFILALEKLTGTNIKVLIGPHAQSCCYEVQNDVAKLFRENIVKMNSRLYLNLSNQITSYCQLNNIDIEASDICTICNNDFWSYRENKTSARQYSFIWI
jgi:YfiH family protein